MTDTPCPGRTGGRRPARTSGPSLSCRSPRIRACRSSGRSSRRRPAGRGPVRSGARCRSSRRASPMSPSSRWHRTSRTAARGRPASRPGRAEALLRSRSMTCGPPAAGPSPAPAALPCADAPGGGPRRAASRRSARSRSSSCRPRSGPAPAPAGTPRRGRDGRSPRPVPGGRRSSTRPAGPGAAAPADGPVRGAAAGPVRRDRETPAGRRPALERLAAPQGGVDAPGPQRRRPRGPAPSSRSRIRVSDGAFPTPKSARRFRARTGSSPPRTCRPDFRSDGIPGEKTASPDVRPTGRLKSRVTVGSGMRSKHARTARSTALASTDACERNLRTFFCSAFACLTAAKPIRRGKSVTGKFVAAAQPADNKRKEILSGIAGPRRPRSGGGGADFLTIGSSDRFALAGSDRKSNRRFQSEVQRQPAGRKRCGPSTRQETRAAPRPRSGRLQATFASPAARARDRPGFCGP